MDAKALAMMCPNVEVSGGAPTVDESAASNPSVRP